MGFDGEEWLRVGKAAGDGGRVGGGEAVRLKMGAVEYVEFREVDAATSSGGGRSLLPVQNAAQSIVGLGDQAKCDRPVSPHPSLPIDLASLRSRIPLAPENRYKPTCLAALPPD
jgi:hypothetical protein